MTEPRDSAGDAGPRVLRRRDLLDRLLALGGVVWIGGIAVPAGAFLWPARTRGPGEEYVEVGAVGDIPVGTSKTIQKDGKPILVIRTAADTFHAVSAICTHLGCIVSWDRDGQRIACPCHAGFFAADGSVQSGPPPRDLAPYRVVVSGDRLRVYG